MNWPVMALRPTSWTCGRWCRWMPPPCSPPSAAIAAEEAFSDLAAPVARFSGGNVPLPVAASLEAEVDVSAARVVAAAHAVLNYR
jgi:hypothetical protein